MCRLYQRRHVFVSDFIVFAPSNPVVSIGPILNLEGLSEAIKNSGAVKTAVSPIIAGKALKGPAVQLMPILRIEPSVAGIADFYRDFADCLFIHHKDEEIIGAIRERGLEPTVADIIMQNEEKAAQLARLISNHCWVHFGNDS